jgi:hypothetical protein
MEQVWLFLLHQENFMFCKTTAKTLRICKKSGINSRALKTCSWAGRQRACGFHFHKIQIKALLLLLRAFPFAFEDGCFVPAVPALFA